jgi:succinyl-CoA synthetase beta subunit
MEYQGKELFRRVGIPVPRGSFTRTADAAAAFVAANPGSWVLKSQVLVGGRGKAGGIKFADTAAEAKPIAEALLELVIKNRQNPEGEPVKSILVEEKLPIALEAYCAITVDRTTKRPVIMVSRHGGMDIEEVAEHHPDDISKFFVDTAVGYSPFIGRLLAFDSHIDPGYRKTLPSIIGALYELFFQYGAKLVEINPLVLTTDGRVFASDAKVELDDDGLFRMPDIKAWEADLPLDEDEQLAVKAGLGIRNYRRFDGNVGTMANGAGLAMGTMDAVKSAGGTVANFLDVGGGANAERVRSCYSLIVADPKVKSLFINIFGGITRCDEVAKGIVEALAGGDLREVPLIIRLTGTNEKEGRAILAAAKMHPVETMDEGAAQAVALAQGK